MNTLHGRAYRSFLWTFRMEKLEAGIGLSFSYKEYLLKMKLEESQFISCQHHDLDRVLRVVTDNDLVGSNALPNTE